MAVLYGDLIMTMLHKTRPYEKIKGSANMLAQNWIKKCSKAVRNGSTKEFIENVNHMVKDLMI